ncbi:MAG: hypothetical protein IKB25_04390 [Lentisphaeria bacterium]|nr:hypothetical protein [Lentisphaeria bacterium]
MSEYKTFVYGATFWGIGYAAASSDVLVVDPGINPGHEFADTFCTKISRLEQLQTELARDFYSVLQKHNAIHDGKIHPAALVPMLCSFILEHKINVLLETVLLEKHPVCVMSGALKWNISADQIIDTLNPSGTVRKKYFNAILHGEDNAVIPEEYLNDEAELPTILPGRFPSEAVLRYPISPETDYACARAKIEAFWRKRPESLFKWKIAVIAPEFYEITDSSQQKDRFFSQGYSDPLLAMDSGIMEALK